jgi:ribosomal protein L11 methyltransferase
LIDYLLQIPFDPELEEVVQGSLFLTRSTGNAVIQPEIITAYFDSAADRDDAAVLLRRTGLNVRSEDRPRVDWLDRYQQSLKPLFVGRSFVIAPDANLIPRDSGRHALVIPQEQAFGTGSHPSTALCIELLEEIDLRRKRALDVGSGSGILALAMLRLGARTVIAFDNDLDAFRPLRENRLRNGGHALSLFIGTIDALAPAVFEVMTMNILPEVIVPMLPIVRQRVRGPLVLSGILKSARDEVVAAAGLPLVSEKEKGEWWAGTFRV